MNLGFLFAFAAVAAGPVHAGIIDYTGSLAGYPNAPYAIGLTYFPDTGDLWLDTNKALFVANLSTDTPFNLFVSFQDTIVFTEFSSVVAACPLFTACAAPQDEIIIAGAGGKLDVVNTSTGAIAISQANENVSAFAESPNGLYTVGNAKISLIPAGGSESNGLVAPVKIAAVPGPFNEDAGYGLQIGSDGNLYFYDPPAQSIYVYDTSGDLLSTIAVPAGYAPYAFATDSSGHYFLAAADGTGISAFDLSGNLLASGSAPVQSCSNCGSIFLATDNTGDVYQFDPNTGGVNEFSFSSAAPEPSTFELLFVAFAGLIAMRQAAAHSTLTDPAETVRT